ncbi:MAG: hypothetical protein ACTSQA_00590 [Candidatus Heimdallarchaeaceae archaeon]
MSKKRMSKTITGTVVAITVIDGENGTMEFNFNDLPEEIQAKFGPFGLGHKLGDAAAGKKGVDAEEAITKVFDGLMDSNWSVRAPAAPKVSTKVISENFGNLSEDEQAAAKAVLASLGINIPGISKE